MAVNPIKYASSTPTGAALKEKTAIGLSAQDYGPTTSTGWYNGKRTNGYTITKAQNGASPLIYAPADDAEVILFCNTTANPGPSSYITHISGALDFLATSDYMVLHGSSEIDNFPEDLVMEGLSCYLDSQIDASVNANPGDWTDVSGNGLEFVSNGSALQIEDLGGYQGFRFNGSGYFQCNDKYGAVNIGGDCTLVFWVFAVDITERDTIFEKVGNGASSYQCSIAITWEVGENFSYYSRKTPAYDYSATSACDTNGGEGAWNMMAIKMSDGLSSTARTGFYSKNGQNWIAYYTSRSNTALVRGKQIRVGTGYAGAVEGDNGIGAVLLYNKMLSDAEIAQIYTATKERYGHS